MSRKFQVFIKGRKCSLFVLHKNKYVPIMTNVPWREIPKTLELITQNNTYISFFVIDEPTTPVDWSNAP